jgi:hypothetical protein
VLRSLTDVIRAVREGTSPLVTVEEGARACHIGFAITQSYRDARPVDVPPVDFKVQGNGAHDDAMAADLVRQS